MAPKPLNPKQSKFVELYLASGNATQSYIDAGYTATGRSAGNNASRLLEHAGIKAALEAATARAAANSAVSAGWALARLQELAQDNGPRSSHLARVQACRAILDYFRPDPPPAPSTATANVNVNVNTNLAGRIDQYEAAFAGAADREGGPPATN